MPLNLTAIASVVGKIMASQQLSSGDTTVYTVPNNRAAKLTKLVLTNTSVSSVTVSASVVPALGVVDGTHRVVSAFPLAGGDSIIVNEVDGVWIGSGDFISVSASAAGAANVTLSGLEFS